MFYFYVLYSLKDGKLYKGYSSNLGDRFLKHQAGGTPSTKYRRPLVLIYAESFSSKSESMARERWAKSPEGGVAFVQMLIEKSVLTDQRKLNCSKLYP